MSKYTIISTQTGNTFGTFMADSVQQALDLFAQSRGFADRRAMWAAGYFEYVDAE